CSAPPACSSAFPPGGQQLRNLTLQVVVSRKADRVLCLSLLDRLVDLRLGEGGVTAEGHLLALRLLPVDLGPQQFLPALCAVDVAWAQLRRQAVAVTIEQEQWMIAGGLEVSVVGALFLAAVVPGSRCCPYPALPGGPNR